MRKTMMRVTRRPRTLRSRAEDSGSALLMVLAAMMVLTVVVTVAVSASIRTSSTARHSTEWNAALAAAEAGVDDYLARLNKDDGYWRVSPDCGNVAMRVPRVARCGWNDSTQVGWVPVPGADRAEFHYDVSTTATPSTGTIDLTSTGRVGDVTRTVRTVLRRGGFGEFLYYTVYETLDPADEATFGRNNYDAQQKCSRYRWASPARPTSPCVNINFITGDTINGPLHTNDGMQIQGSPQFKGTVTTSYNKCKTANGRPAQYSYCYYANGSASPRFDKGIAFRDEVELPTSIGDLRQYVATGRADAGCLYTGPTRIQLLAPRSGSTVSQMKVWSPHSKSSLNPGCGNHAAAWPQTLDIPHNNVIVIQDVPAAQSSPAAGACALGSIGGVFPQEGDVSLSLNESSCRHGTLYLEGALTGRLTVAADNNILITDDLTYAGGKTALDALGLIAQNSVKIYHPYGKTCSARNPNGTCRTWSSNSANLKRANTNTVFQNPKVYAAILTLQHSITVQNYDQGASLGTLTIFGTMAQRFRGPVGQGTGSGMNGYLKDYEYDTRMRYSPPPYFLDPVRSSWGVKAYGEASPAY